MSEQRDLNDFERGVLCGVLLILALVFAGVSVALACRDEIFLACLSGLCCAGMAFFSGTGLEGKSR